MHYFTFVRKKLRLVGDRFSPVGRREDDGKMKEKKKRRWREENNERQFHLWGEGNTRMGRVYGRGIKTRCANTVLREGKEKVREKRRRRREGTIWRSIKRDRTISSGRRNVRAVVILGTVLVLNPVVLFLRVSLPSARPQKLQQIKEWTREKRKRTKMKARDIPFVFFFFFFLILLLLLPLQRAVNSAGFAGGIWQVKEASRGRDGKRTSIFIRVRCANVAQNRPKNNYK